MKLSRGLVPLALMLGLSLSWSISKAGGQDYSGEDSNKKILKQGLLGAGVGAISAETSGGKAGTGALVGAGTNVIGGALLDTLTGSSQPKPQPVYTQQAPVQYASQAPVQYAQQAPVQYAQQQAYPVQQQYVEPQPVYVQQQPVYYQSAPPAEDPGKKIIKQGLLGAGVGALSAEASGGKAGKGALIGAGTNVIGGALLDTLLGGSQPQQAPQPTYYQQPVYQQPTYQQQSSQQPRKKILRKYDSQGNVVSEEEVWE